MKSCDFYFCMFFVLAACGPLEAPDPKDIARKLHRYGSACESEIESTITAATWIEDVYARNRKELDAIIASKITDETDSSFSYSNGDDSVKFNVTNSIFGGGYYLRELQVRDGQNVYRGASGYAYPTIPFWEVDLNGKFTVDQPVIHRYDDTMSEYFVYGDYSCRTPTQAYDVAVTYNFEALVTSKAFRYRSKGID